MEKSKEEIRLEVLKLVISSGDNNDFVPNNAKRDPLPIATKWVQWVNSVGPKSKK